MPGMWGDGPQGGAFGARIDPRLIDELEHRAAARREAQGIGDVVMVRGRGEEPSFEEQLAGLSRDRLPERNPDIPFREGLAGTAGEMLYGVPIAGPTLLEGGQRLAAGKHALLEGRPYAEALEDVQTRQEDFRRLQPLIAGSAQAGGASILTPAMPARGLIGKAAGEALLAGTDAFVREEDPRLAAASGGLAALVPIPGLRKPLQDKLKKQLVRRGTIRRHVADEIEPQQDMVSHRYPSAPGATENPRERHNLVLGSEDVEVLPNNVALLRGYNALTEKAPRGYVGVPGLRHVMDPSVKASDAELVQEFKRFGRDNLLFLHSKVDPAEGEMSRNWYEGAHRIRNDWAGHYQRPPMSIGVGVASMSPGMDWFKNATLGQRVIDITQNRVPRSIGAPDASGPITREMRQKIRDIEALNKYDGRTVELTSPSGKKHLKTYPDFIGELMRGREGPRLADLEDPRKRAIWIRAFDEAHLPRHYRGIHPEGDLLDYVLNKDGKTRATVGWGGLGEIAKADAALRNPDPAFLSQILGEEHKIRFFANDINNPYDTHMRGATIDTHMKGGLHLQPFAQSSHYVRNGTLGSRGSDLTGVKGTYGIDLDATRDAADIVGWLPRMIQSETWEKIRAMFPRERKTAAFARLMEEPWRRVDDPKTKFTEEDAREAIYRAAGEIKPPSWLRSDLKRYDPRRVSTYADDIY